MRTEPVSVNNSKFISNGKKPWEIEFFNNKIIIFWVLFGGFDVLLLFINPFGYFPIFMLIGSLWISTYGFFILQIFDKYRLTMSKADKYGTFIENIIFIYIGLLMAFLTVIGIWETPLGNFGTDVIIHLFGISQDFFYIVLIR